jgi:hypothetical protein
LRVAAFLAVAGFRTAAFRAVALPAAVFFPAAFLRTFLTVALRAVAFRPAGFFLVAPARPEAAFFPAAFAAGFRPALVFRAADFPVDAFAAFFVVFLRPPVALTPLPLPDPRCEVRPRAGRLDSPV